MGDLEDHVSTPTAITTVGPPLGDELLPTEGHAAVAAVPGAHRQPRGINEHGGYPSTEYGPELRGRLMSLLIVTWTMPGWFSR